MLSDGASTTVSKGVSVSFMGTMGKEAVEKMKRSRGCEVGECIIREVWETIPYRNTSQSIYGHLEVTILGI